MERHGIPAKEITVTYEPCLYESIPQPVDRLKENFVIHLASCEPHKRFPIGLLQLSIKITNEAPAGIRAGLKGSYAWLNQDVLDTVAHAVSVQRSVLSTDEIFATLKRKLDRRNPGYEQ